MRRQILILLACVCMLFLIPTAIFADSAESSVYVGGKEMKASKDGTIVSYYVNGTDGIAGTVSNDEPQKWNAKLWYDADNNRLTLELSNLYAQGNQDAAASKEASGIYTTSKLYVNFNGENYVKGFPYRENVYGIYAGTDFTFSETSNGKLAVETADHNGVINGIYSAGNLNILGGELIINCGDSVKKQNDPENYGIYAYGILIGGNGFEPNVTVAAGDSYFESCGMFGYSGITVKSGYVYASTGYAKSGYADGMLSNRSMISIEGGEIHTSADRAYGGMATGICANVLDISGGNVETVGGNTKNGEQQSVGIYVNYDINIRGGEVRATGREAYGDVSFGINSWRGDITISGDSVVYAHGGSASYSVGLCCERRYDSSFGNRAGGDVTIKDNAKVYASTDDSDNIRVYSYGIFVGGNLLIEDDTYVESVAGRVSNVDINGLTNREKRSFGIYLGDDVYDGPSDTNYIEGGYTDTSERHTFHITGGTVISKTLDNDNGNIPDDDGNSVFNRSYAVVFYDADKIEFSNSEQTNDQWYQWKINGLDEMMKSTKEIYPDAEKWQSATQYFHVEPIAEEPDPVYKDVTFKVVNGTWADGTNEDKKVKVELEDEDGKPSESGTAALEGFIPTGMLPSEGYEGGAWDAEIPTVVSGVEGEVYTYIFVKKEDPEQPPVDPDEPDDPADPKDSDDTNDSNDFEEPEKPDNDEADDSDVPNEPKEHEKPEIDNATDSGDDFDLVAVLVIMVFAAAAMTATVVVRRRG